MAYKIQTFSNAPLIYAKHSGAVSFPEIVEMRDSLITKSNIEGIKNIIANFSDSKGTLTADEHYQFANAFLENFPHGVHFSIVVNGDFVPPERIEFISNINSTRGIMMYLCYNVMEALQWLDISPEVIRQH